jgi:purine-binding chemotaxis protein CheW
MPASAAVPERPSLVVAVGPRAFAVPLVNVVETMRPLPIQTMLDMPSFVRGLSIIRGRPVPVVDLAEATGVSGVVSARVVLLRVAEREVALAVSRVVGVRNIAGATLEELPPLLRAAQADVVDAIGTLDSDLLMVLRATRILPEESWRAVDLHGVET